MLLPTIIRVSINAARDFDPFGAFHEFFATGYQFLNRRFGEGVFIVATIDGVVVAKRKDLFGIGQPFFDAETAG